MSGRDQVLTVARTAVAGLMANATRDQRHLQTLAWAYHVESVVTSAGWAA